MLSNNRKLFLSNWFYEISLARAGICLISFPLIASFCWISTCHFCLKISQHLCLSSCHIKLNISHICSNPCIVKYESPYLIIFFCLSTSSKLSLLLKVISVLVQSVTKKIKFFWWEVMCLYLLRSPNICISTFLINFLVLGNEVFIIFPDSIFHLVISHSFQQLVPWSLRYRHSVFYLHNHLAYRADQISLKWSEKFS